MLCLTGTGIELCDSRSKITNRFLYIPNQTQCLINLFTNHILPTYSTKELSGFLKLTKLWRKKQPKRDLLRLLLSLLIEVVFFKYVFSFHSSFGVLIFIFNMRVWMNYLFYVIKNNVSNLRYTSEGEKSSKCCARNHTILFVRLKGTAQEYLFRSFQSLHTKIFCKTISKSKFLFAALSRPRCWKH